MNVDTLQESAVTMLSQQPYDVLIVGAGISGIGCACHLTSQHPTKKWAVLEGRDGLGGTWDLFKYPGIRSDSDLHTFSYSFKPWTSTTAIAGADEIMAYLNETVDEFDVRSKIHFRHRVLRADWDSATALWTLRVSTPSGEQRVQCRWMFSATGYYDYEEGFRPTFSGEESFSGDVIHPQHWPEEFDYTGKRIAVIGSGATAVTLLPALADDAAHITQIQRTPSYIVTRPRVDRVARFLSSILSDRLVHTLARWKNTRQQRYFYQLCQRFPNVARRLLENGVRKSLPKGFRVAEHFHPPYDPWDQRLCAVPDGDYFRAIHNGKASIVTGQIAQFEETGVRMTSGELISADIIVLATGLNVKLFDHIELRVDGSSVSLPSCYVYRGLMLSDVPNFAFAIGYTNSSWTLKVDLVCEYFCQLLHTLDASGDTVCTPVLPAEELAARPLFDFDAGYVRRAAHQMPKQGLEFPWTMTTDYVVDQREFRRRPVLDRHLRLQRQSQPP
ncbi:MAG: NAD(P)/FAD-dependent oxidoreductase, partial [Pseudomonadota bacterium]